MKKNHQISIASMCSAVLLCIATGCATSRSAVSQISGDGKRVQLEYSTNKKSVLAVKPLKAAINSRAKIDDGKNQSLALMATTAELSLIGGEPTEAEERARKVLKADSKNIEAGQTLVKAALIRGRFSEALLMVDNLMEHDAKNPNLLSLKGLAHYLNNEIIDARECWKKALTINSSHVAAQMNLGALYFQNRNFAAAGAMFERVLKTQPQNFDAQVGKALVMSTQGNADGARKILLSVLDKNKESSLVLYNLAVIERERFQNYNAALDYTNKYLDSAKSDRFLVERAVAMREELKNIIAKSEQGKLTDADLRSLAEKSSQATVSDGLDDTMSANEPVKTASTGKQDLQNVARTQPKAAKKPVPRDDESLSALEDAIK